MVASKIELSAKPSLRWDERRGRDGIGHVILLVIAAESYTVPEYIYNDLQLEDKQRSVRYSLECNRGTLME